MPKDGITIAEEMFKVNPNLQIAILSAPLGCKGLATIGLRQIEPT